jgi:hypothetical protein
MGLINFSENDRMRTLSQTITLCLCLALPSALQAMTRDDIAIYSKEGVKVIFPDEAATTPHTFPDDIDPDKLLTAELLDFSNVPIGDDPDFFQWLAKFTNLRKLVLDNTTIHATPELLRAFGEMPELQKLDLSNNPLFEGKPHNTAKLSAIWGNVPKLTELKLTQTNGTVENYGSLALLQHLTALHLGNNPQLCARSLLGNLTSWSGGECTKALELSKLPLAVLDLSATQLTHDPLPDLPVDTLRELSLENNQLETLAMQALPNLEYWNLVGNPNVTLADDFGNVRVLKALQQLKHDDSAMIPTRLKQKFAAKSKARDVPADTSSTPSTAITIAPPPKQPSVLKPKTADEIQTWLSGADQVKHQAAWKYLQAEAEKNDKSAIHWLGQAYHKGWGTKPDWVKARAYYQQAKQQGDTNAQASEDALDTEAANAITRWGNTGKSTAKAQLAKTLYSTLAQSGDKKAQGWLDWLNTKK